MLSLEDITKKLTSLQFDSALPDEERRGLIQLRTRNLAVVSTACAQAVYFVSILNEVNEVILEKSRSLNKSCITSSFSGLKIGIIGCGRLGKQLATVLLDLGVVNASNLYISTRCPENLEDFQNKGVFCCFDNRLVGESVDVLFLCCLPSQLNTVSKDLRGNVNGVVFSFVAGLSLARISQLLDYQNIIKPNLIFKSDIVQTSDESNPWKFGRNVPEILADQKCILHTCPLYSEEVSLLEMDVKLCESFVLAVLNECTRHGIERHEAVRVCNSTLFGLTSGHPSYLDVNSILFNNEERVGRESGENIKLFPVFDVVKMTSEGTLLGKKILENDTLRTAFTEKYQKVLHK